MEFSESVLITGASGLLGKALVRQCLKQNLVVYAQYHHNIPFRDSNLTWLYADFSESEGVAEFLRSNQRTIGKITYLFNNFGPLNPRTVAELSGSDFVTDYHLNLVTAVDMGRFFLKRDSLKSLVNIGFEFCGLMKPYRNILSYAAAKNALWLVTLAWSEKFAPVNVNMGSPVSIAGAEYERSLGPVIPPERAAEELYRILKSDLSGKNILIGNGS